MNPRIVQGSLAVGHERGLFVSEGLLEKEVILEEGGILPTLENPNMGVNSLRVVIQTYQEAVLIKNLGDKLKHPGRLSLEDLQYICEALNVKHVGEDGLGSPLLSEFEISLELVLIPLVKGIGQRGKTNKVYLAKDPTLHPYGGRSLSLSYHLVPPERR